MEAVLLLFVVVGVGALVLWLLVTVVQILASLFFAMMAFIAMIFTGKWLWKFLTEDDEPEAPTLPR